MERKALARWLVVFALACFGVILFAGIAFAQDGATTIQGSNSSDTAAADTGAVDGENSSDFNVGPAANGNTGASAQQLGTNSGTVSQSARGRSGDPVAGGQVTGVVGDNVTVQNMNSAIDPSADSGDVDLDNDADISVGPFASAVTGTAQASQLGDNATDISQEAIGWTGDSVAGSQVTGIVGEGEHIVQNMNSALCETAEACAESGNLDLENEVEIENSVGPFAETDDGAVQASQIGDNDAVITQSAEGGSGDALFGSQVTGLVGGSATVQNSNSSECAAEDACAESGSAEVENDIVDLVVGPVADTDTGGTAQVSQTGDNTADVTQELTASSGDALSGSQVTGAVGDEDGFLVVQNQQASEGDSADTDDVNTFNQIQEATVGPEAEVGDNSSNAQASQNGDNDVSVAQLNESKSGDALAGAQVTGAVGYHDVTVMNSNSANDPVAESGDIETDAEFNDIDELEVGPQSRGDGSSTSQLGDNSASVEQAFDLASGDAVAGGQVTGVVAAGSTVTVMNQNSSVDAEASTGNVPDDGEAENEAAIDVGPEADAEGDGNAQVSQLGDNAAAIEQSAVAASGDAVGGAQVTGVVAGDNAEVTIANMNSCAIDDAAECALVETGDVVVENDLEDEELQVGPRADADADGATASGSQIGDNLASVDQSIAASSGDGVGGAQVTGAVTGDGSKVTVMNSNSADTATVDTGDVDAENELDVDLGVEADADGNAQAQQTGDNSLDFSQDLSIDSGDAVAGSQVTGVVGGAENTISVQNSDESSTATSGDVDGENSAEGDLSVEADSASGAAMVSLNGDVVFDGAQELDTSSGDSIAGTQVNGVVGGLAGLPAVNGFG